MSGNTATTQRKHKPHIYPDAEMISYIIEQDGKGIRQSAVCEMLTKKFGRAPCIENVGRFMPSSKKFDPDLVALRLKGDKLFARRVDDIKQSATPAQPEPAVEIVSGYNDETKEYLWAVSVLLGIDEATAINDLVRLAKKVGALDVHERKD